MYVNVTKLRVWILNLEPISLLFQTEKFVSVKGLTYDLISGCREVIRVRDIVIRLAQRCEKMTSTMEEVVSKLIHSNTHFEDENYITEQPSNLNPEWVMKMLIM